MVVIVITSYYYYWYDDDVVCCWLSVLFKRPGWPQVLKHGAPKARLAERSHVFAEEPKDPYWKQVRYTPGAQWAFLLFIDGAWLDDLPSGSSRCGVFWMARASSLGGREANRCCLRTDPFPSQLAFLNAEAAVWWPKRHGSQGL